MHDFSAMSGKELANMVRERIYSKIGILETNADLIREVIRRLEKSDGLPSGIEEALNMGDGAYRP